MSALDPAKDFTIIYDTSDGDHGRVTPFSFVKSVIQASGGYLTLTEDPVTGRITFGFNQASLTPADRRVDTATGSGLYGGGPLSSDLSLSFQLNNLFLSSTVARDDYLAFYDITAAVTRRATISDVTFGLVDDRPLGSI